MLAGGSWSLSVLAILKSRSICALSALASALADGIALDLATTWTTPSIPGCRSQKYLTVPALVNLTVRGLGLSPNGIGVSTPFFPV